MPIRGLCFEPRNGRDGLPEEATVRIRVKDCSAQSASVDSTNNVVRVSGAKDYTSTIVLAQTVFLPTHISILLAANYASLYVAHCHTSRVVTVSQQTTYEVAISNGFIRDVKFT